MSLGQTMEHILLGPLHVATSPFSIWVQQFFSRSGFGHCCQLPQPRPDDIRWRQHFHRPGTRGTFQQLFSQPVSKVAEGHQIVKSQPRSSRESILTKTIQYHSSRPSGLCIDFMPAQSLPRPALQAFSFFFWVNSSWQPPGLGSKSLRSALDRVWDWMNSISEPQLFNSLMSAAKPQVCLAVTHLKSHLSDAGASI